jgi:hypothetical protein
MFQWLYEFFMQHIMPLIASIMAFLGVDTKKVSFEGLPDEQVPVEHAARDAHDDPPHQ